MGQWLNFFGATASGAATLTGLVFVGLSINLHKILSISYLTNRALEGLILLVNIFIVSLLSIVPQTTMFLGLEISGFNLIVWFIVLRLGLKMYRKSHKEHKRRNFAHIVLTQLAVLPFFAASFCFMIGDPAGFYILIGAIFMSYFKALMDSWVLLVEINR